MKSSLLLLGLTIVASAAEGLQSGLGSDRSVFGSDMSSGYDYGSDWSSGYASDRSGMGSDSYDYYGSEFDPELLELFDEYYGGSEFDPELLESFDGDYGSDFYDFLESEYPEYFYGSGFDYSEDYGSEEYFESSWEPLERAGGLNDCSGKKNGSPCKKRCSSPACKKAKCWENTCLTSRKYRILAAGATQQKNGGKTEYNNCVGKKDGDSCKKQCSSKTCKEAKCCKTVCLTGRKYNILKGNC